MKKVSPQAKGRAKKGIADGARARTKDRKLESGRDGSRALGGRKTGFMDLGKSAPASLPVGRETKVRSGAKNSKTYIELAGRKDKTQAFVRGSK